MPYCSENIPTEVISAETNNSCNYRTALHFVPEEVNQAFSYVYEASTLACNASHWNAKEHGKKK